MGQVLETQFTYVKVLQGLDYRRILRIVNPSKMDLRAPNSVFHTAIIFGTSLRYYNYIWLRPQSFLLDFHPHSTHSLVEEHGNRTGTFKILPREKCIETVTAIRESIMKHFNKIMKKLEIF